MTNIVEQPVGVCVLEDEPYMGEQIRDGILDHFVDGSAVVSLTDNLKDAYAIYEAGNCDLFVADIVVKSERNSQKANADAQELLHVIRANGQFVARIGHTAYKDKYARITQSKLVDVAFDKHDFDSTEKLIEHSIKVVDDIRSFRQQLTAGFHALCQAAETDDTIDCHNHLEECRQLFGHLVPPSYAPPDYLKIASLLSAFVMRLSSVPSGKFALYDITPQLCSHLWPLVQAMECRSFKYERDAVPILIKLEALGYPVIMRVDI